MNDYTFDTELQYLCIMRHGEARLVGNDTTPSLTERGKNEVRQVSDWISSRALQVEEIRHSGILRAQQTANIVSKCQPQAKVVAGSGLTPNDAVIPIAESLDGENHSIMIVSHLPFVGLLASYLVDDKSNQEAIGFPTAGLVVLVRENDRWDILAEISPAKTT